MLFERRSITVVPADLFRRNGLSAMTPTGLSITPDNAMTVTAVFQAIRFLSFMVASLPLITYQKKGEDRRRADEHPLYSILHDSPNPEMTAFDFESTTWSHVFARGNGIAEIEYDERGQVRYLWPLNPGAVDLVRNENYELRYQVTLPKRFNYEPRYLRPEQIFHKRGLSKEGLWGLSVIAAHKNAIALAKAAEVYGAAHFGNGAEPGVVMKHPKTLSTEAHARIKESWEQAHQGLDNAHRMAILEEGMEIDKIGFSNKDAEYIETKQFQIVEIARMFGIPPHLLFDLSHATFTNIEHQSLEFVIYHLRPWLISGEQQIKRSLFLERERRNGYYSEYLVDAIVRGDIQTRWSAYNTGFNIGAFSINDILRKENMNTIGEKGDGRFVPLNMAPLGEDGLPVKEAPPAPEEPPVEPTPMDEEETPDDEMQMKSADVLIMPILLDAADRIVRREVNEWNQARARYEKKPEKFTDWAEQFYKQHYPEFIRTVLYPLVQARFIPHERMKDFMEQYCDERGAISGEWHEVEPEYIANFLAGVTNGD